MDKEKLEQALKSIGEDAVVSLIRNVVRPFAEDYIAKSENKIDDIILPFMGQLEDALVKLADGIDGEVDHP
jgi:hypothetical protein